MTQQDKDVETVKRAADKLSRTGQQRHECTCATPKRDSLLGRTQCIECQGTIVSKPVEGRMVEGDIITRGLPVDENLEAAKKFVSGGNVDDFLASLPECLCVSPNPDRLGPPAICYSCGKRIGTQASMQLIKARCAPYGPAQTEDDSWDLNPGRVVEIAPSEPWDDQLDVPEMPEYNAVTPPHYQRGPRVALSEYDTAEYYDIQCMDVMRCMQDPRLATAFKYIWRVAFGGKSEPWDSRKPEEVDARDINSAIWYLQDYLANPPQALADGGLGAYTPQAIGRPASKD